MKNLLLIVSLTILPFNIFAGAVEIDGIYYNLDTESKTAEVTSNPNNYRGTVEIPSKIVYDGVEYTINTIGVDAFRECGKLSAVTIPNSVTVIGNSAFKSCGGLKYINIPSCVTTIGDEAFYSSGLTSINIPSSVTSIGENAFQVCYFLTSVSITDISAWCSIHFSNGASNPFCHAYQLYINNKETKDLIIPDNVNSIGDYVFYGCELTSVTLPNNVTSIGDYAFAYCYDLISINIPNSVTSIGDYAFESCIDLTSINIPKSVTSIGQSAFEKCNSIESVYITDITSWCNINFSDINSNPFTNKDAYKLFINNEEIKDLVIPYGVKSIGNYVFSGCSGLTSVSLPSSVTSIGDFAFANSFLLTSINIPNSVTSIGENAFKECSRLSQVNITDLTSWCEIQFSNNSSNPLFYAHDLYLNGTIIKDLIIPDSVTAIGNYCFYSCSSLTSVVIPNSVTTLGEQVFRGCSGMTNVTLPNSVTSISNYFFYGCSGLTKVTIPNSVISIGDYSFFGCNGMTEVTIPNSVKVIGLLAFYNCSNLLTITIPESVTKICDSSFNKCSVLTSVAIGRSVSEIGHQSFAYCPELNDFYCYGEIVPIAENDVFRGSNIEKATLHVPANAVNKYRAVSPWKNFMNIVALEGETPDVPKCAIPKISYQNGDLKFSCETEDVTFVSEITDPDIKKSYNEKISLSVTYYINVYATKVGYYDSEVATATLCWVESEPKTEGIENGIATVTARPVMIQYISGTFNITGLEDGETVTIYSLDGEKLGQGLSMDGSAQIQTNLINNKTIIVRFGKESIKCQVI